MGFYCDGLGLEPAQIWPDNQGVVLVLDRGKATLGLSTQRETDQFYPSLIRNTTPVEPPYGPDEGYQLTRDLADECIGWIREQKAIAPERPFMAYFSTGSAHAPQPSTTGLARAQ